MKLIKNNQKIDFYLLYSLIIKFIFMCIVWDWIGSFAIDAVLKRLVDYDLTERYNDVWFKQDLVGSIKRLCHF